MVKENRKCGSHRVLAHPMTYAGAYPPYTTATYRTTIMYYSGSARKLQVLHCIFLVHRCAAAHSHIYFLCEIRVWTVLSDRTCTDFLFSRPWAGRFYRPLCLRNGKLHKEEIKMGFLDNLQKKAHGMADGIQKNVAGKEKVMRRQLMDAPEDYVIKMARQGSRIAQEVAEERGLYY